MQEIPFSKLHGAGNDFILVDNRKAIFSPKREEIAFLCRRSFGIGADGLILVEPSDLADVRMRIFNGDGSEAEMCGNGVRCLFRFMEGISSARSLTLETMDRLLEVWREGEEIAVDMGAVVDAQWNLELEGHQIHYLDTGVPHVVLFLPDIEGDVLKEMAAIYRSHEAFPKGVNVNIARVEEGKVVMRTWERGVEGETFACGTGACAVGVAAARHEGAGQSVQVRVASGDTLRVSFLPDLSKVTLCGPAQFVYSGTFVRSVGQNMHIGAAGASS